MAKSSSLSSCGLTILRIVIGIIFLVHGWQKIHVFGFHGVEASFLQIGIPLPVISSAVVILVEFLGGIALILGLATRWAALLIAIDMAGAIFFVHFKGGFYVNHGGYEYALSLLAACLALTLTGAGSLAIDSLL
ncbi:MAG TPA: DoxX family protein [Terriglobales bacterium]|nr:DoxX family protein [Terriglobales bacterium]